VICAQSPNDLQITKLNVGNKRHQVGYAGRRSIDLSIGN